MTAEKICAPFPIFFLESSLAVVVVVVVVKKWENESIPIIIHTLFYMKYRFYFPLLTKIIHVWYVCVFDDENGNHHHHPNSFTTDPALYFLTHKHIITVPGGSPAEENYRKSSQRTPSTVREMLGVIVIVVVMMMAIMALQLQPFHRMVIAFLWMHGWLWVSLLSFISLPNPTPSL